LNASGSSRVLRRSAITDTCAIVNDSIAPNAYMLPRKSVRPGRSTTIESSPPKTSNDNQGVLNFGCSRRKTSGSCLYDAMAYVMRDARDHAGVGRDQEDRRSQDADVDLRGLQHLTVQPQVLHEAEHRIVLEATLARTDAEQRLVPRARSSPPVAPIGRSSAV